MTQNLDERVAVRLNRGDLERLARLEERYRKLGIRKSQLVRSAVRLGLVALLADPDQPPLLAPEE